MYQDLLSSWCITLVFMGNQGLLCLLCAPLCNINTPIVSAISLILSRLVIQSDVLAMQAKCLKSWPVIIYPPRYYFFSFAAVRVLVLMLIRESGCLRTVCPIARKIPLWSPSTRSTAMNSFRWAARTFYEHIIPLNGLSMESFTWDTNE